MFAAAKLHEDFEKVHDLEKIEHSSSEWPILVQMWHGIDSLEVKEGWGGADMKFGDLAICWWKPLWKGGWYALLPL